MVCILSHLSSGSEPRRNYFYFLNSLFGSYHSVCKTDITIPEWFFSSHSKFEDFKLIHSNLLSNQRNKTPSFTFIHLICLIYKYVLTLAVKVAITLEDVNQIEKN